MTNPSKKALETSTIDRLFLELSQVSKARTSRELKLMDERDEARRLLGEVSTLLRGDARVADELEIERRIEVFLFPPCKNASCKDGKIPPHTLREVNMGIENLCPDCNPRQDRRRR